MPARIWLSRPFETSTTAVGPAIGIEPKNPKASPISQARIKGGHHRTSEGRAREPEVKSLEELTTSLLRDKAAHMRVGVLLFVSLGLLVITGACGGPGPSDDACTSGGNTCVDLSLPHAPCDEVPYPCSANGDSGQGFACCAG